MPLLQTLEVSYLQDNQNQVKMADKVM